MTAGRRPLEFATLDEVVPEVERLLREGHTTVGHWSLAQICRHLAATLRRVVDLPASTPVDPSQRVSEAEKQRVLDSGQIPEGLPGPPEIMPPEGLDPHAEAEGLRAAIAHFRAAPGPAVPHRFFGPLTRDEWDRLQRIHCAHHLSFALPAPTTTGR
jgi:hypothetical protein